MRCLQCVRDGTVEGQLHDCPGPDSRAVAEWVWLMFGNRSTEDQIQTIVEDASTLGHAVNLAHEVVERPARPRVPRPKARKIGGAYEATGTIVASFLADDGTPRYVFRFDMPAGLLHIFNADQLVIENGNGK